MAKPTIFSAVEAGWSSEDWDLSREKRAAILEHDEKLPRKKAEELAAAQTYTRYGIRPKQ